MNCWQETSSKFVNATLLPLSTIINQEYYLNSKGIYLNTGYKKFPCFNINQSAYSAQGVRSLMS